MHPHPFPVTRTLRGPGYEGTLVIHSAVQPSRDTVVTAESRKITVEPALYARSKPPSRSFTLAGDGYRGRVTELSAITLPDGRVFVDEVRSVVYEVGYFEAMILAGLYVRDRYDEA